jgi:hypothetical protein
VFIVTKVQSTPKPGLFFCSRKWFDLHLQLLTKSQTEKNPQFHAVFNFCNNGDILYGYNFCNNGDKMAEKIVAQSRAWTYLAKHEMIELDDKMTFHCRKYVMQEKRWVGYVRFNNPRRLSELWYYDLDAQWTRASKCPFSVDATWQVFGEKTKQGKRNDLTKS